MNATQLTKEQLADLKREFAHLMIGDMSPKELFEFAIHRITCDVAMMKQEELKNFGDVGVGALAPVANLVRVASRAGESIAHAVAATNSETDEIFDDVQGRLIKEVLGFWSQVVR